MLFPFRNYRSCSERKIVSIPELGKEMEFWESRKQNFSLLPDHTMQGNWASFGNLLIILPTLTILCVIPGKKNINSDTWQFLIIAFNQRVYVKATYSSYCIPQGWLLASLGVPIVLLKPYNFPGSSLSYPINLCFSSQKLLDFLGRVPSWADVLKMFWSIQIRK